MLHDNFEVRDPIDATSQSHVIGTAEKNYSNTQGNWVRYSVPFIYENANTPEFLLLTFTTNKTPGGGAANDEVLLDDLELIYSSSKINELSNPFSAYYGMEGLVVENFGEIIDVYSFSGQKVAKGSSETLKGLKLNSGIYFLRSSSNFSMKLFVP